MARVKLSDPRWEGGQGDGAAPERGTGQAEFETEITVSVAAQSPPDLEHLTRVEFTCWPDIEKGRERFSSRQSGHIRAGRASALFFLSRPTVGEAGNAVATCRFLFQAKHSRSEPILSAPLQAAAARQDPCDGVVLYSPRFDEYLVCDSEPELRPLLEGMLGLTGLRDRSRQAWRETDPSRRYQALQTLSQDAQEFLAKATAGSAAAGVEELLLLQGNERWGKLAGWNYIAACDREAGKDPLPGRYRRLTPAGAQRRLDALLKRKPEPSGPSRWWTGKLALHLLATPPKQGSPWEWRKPGTGGGKEALEAFRFTAVAAAMRYFAGWNGAEAAFDPLHGKLRLGASGQASYSLLEGEAKWILDLPDAGGVNLVWWLRGVKYASRFLLDPRRECLVKISLEGSVSAFVGATALGALAVGLDRIPRQEASATLDAFAGAQGKAGGHASVQWSAGSALPFHALGGLGMQGGVSLGLGLEGRLKVTWEQGRFRFEMSAAAAWGIGAKGGFIFEADAGESWKLIGHLMDCVDFHFVAEISAAAYRVYTAYAFAALQGAADGELERMERERDWERDQAVRFQAWLDNLGADLEKFKANLWESCAHRSLLRKSPPQALGQAVRTILQSHGRNDSRILMHFLYSTLRPGALPPGDDGADHKLKWTLRHVSDVEIPDRGDPLRERRKAEALQEGIRRIRAFGLEWDGSGWQAPENDGSFTTRFRQLLRENGLDGTA